MARRRTNVFSLSFLDAITCGFGAVVLFYMVINASVGVRSGRLTGDLQAEVDRLEIEVLEGYKNLVELRNAKREADDERVVAQGLSKRLIEALTEIQEELATFEASTLARREHINKLKADLKSLEEDTKRLSASVVSEETPGDRIRTFVGDGDRQYLTGLKVGGERILILVDGSASMLGETVVNIIRRRNLTPATRLQAPKWQQAVSTVDWLTTQIPRTSQFQIYTFDERARAVVEGTDGEWLDGSDPAVLDRAVASLRGVAPEKGTSLYHAFSAISSLNPLPDNVILLVDGLPTRGRAEPSRNTVTSRQRVRLYNRAIKELPDRIPINVILFPIEGDPVAASAFWKLAMASGGSYFSPSKDWP